MALKLKTRSRKRLSMTSLIDVIFLLLLFFMLSSTFSKYGEIDLTGAAQGATMGDRPVLFLRASPDGVMLNGQTMQDDALPDALKKLSDGEDRLALISLAPDVTSQRLIDLLVAVRKVPGISPVVLEAAGPKKDDL